MDCLCGSSTDELSRGSWKFKIDGHCDDGYEKVKELFEKNYHLGHDKHSTLVVYVGEKCVIDLTGSQKNESPDAWGPEKLTCQYGAGKTISAIMMCMLHSQGLFKYEDKVCTHWPDFGKNGKDQITIADVMRHESKMPKFHKQIELEWLTTENIKQNKIGQMIEEDSQQVLPQGISRIYSTMKDMIANEIFRRIEPQKRTMGEYWRQELGDKIGVPNIYISMNEEELKRVYEYQLVGAWHQVKNAWKSTPEDGRFIIAGFGDILKHFGGGIAANNKRMDALTSGNKTQESFEFCGKGVTKFNVHLEKGFKVGEIPGAATYSNSRSMAKLAAYMANGGQFGGHRIISEESWAEFHSEPKVELELPTGHRTIYVKGGCLTFDLKKFQAHPICNEDYRIPVISKNLEEYATINREGWYGKFGMGGTIFMWHPQYKIAFSYVAADPIIMDIMSFKASYMQKAVVEAIQNLTK